jgi:hypothetical protein
MPPQVPSARMVKIIIATRFIRSIQPAWSAAAGDAGAERPGIAEAAYVDRSVGRADGIEAGNKDFYEKCSTPADSLLNTIPLYLYVVPQEFISKPTKQRDNNKGTGARKHQRTPQVRYKPTPSQIRLFQAKKGDHPEDTNHHVRLKQTVQPLKNIYASIAPARC